VNYTCATEGCGEPIYFGELSKRWRHEVSDNITCNLRGDFTAHPAGGTNTTPPEELERDVKKVTMDYLAEELMAATPLRVSAQQIWDHIEPLIQSYADQAVEEARAEAQLVIDDLREQLDRALVPKFKVGDRVIYEGKEDVVLIDPYFMYSLKDSAGSKLEKWLAPLETKTPPCPLDHRQSPARTSAFRPWAFCPLCGESLTKEGA
jgi:hypothetical protein